MNAFESIKQGLEEAKEFSKGKRTHAIVRKISVPADTAVEVCARAGHSQSDFAKSVGVTKGTLLNREQGSRTPQGSVGSGASRSLSQNRNV